MSWALVARKDFQDAIRSRILGTLLGLFVVALVVVTLGHRLVASYPRTSGLIVYLIELTKWLVPVAALLAGYNAVVGERAGGTLTFLLGLPHTRRDVIVGKAVGRTGAVLLPVTAGFLGTAVAVVVAYPTFRVWHFLAVVGASLLLAATFVSVAVGLSALVRSPVRTVAVTMGLFVVWMFLWDLVPTGIYFLLHGSVPGSQVPPDWFFFVQRLNPLDGYLALVTAALPTLESPVPSPRAAYLSPAVTLLVFAAWLVGPLAVGYLRFRSADLS
ncbi:MAG: ABC transporter permease subunit [Haloarculaceae archaeon]